jgi:hypothetical protein
MRLHQRPRVEISVELDPCEKWGLAGIKRRRVIAQPSSAILTCDRFMRLQRGSRKTNGGLCVMFRSFISRRQLTSRILGYRRHHGCAASTPFRVVQHAAALSTTACAQRQARIPKLEPPPETDIEEVFVKGSGPGGQKIVRLPSCAPAT